MESAARIYLHLFFVNSRINCGQCVLPLPSWPWSRIIAKTDLFGWRSKGHRFKLPGEQWKKISIGCSSCATIESSKPERFLILLASHLTKKKIVSPKTEEAVDNNKKNGKSNCRSVRECLCVKMRFFSLRKLEIFWSYSLVCVCVAFSVIRVQCVGARAACGTTAFVDHQQKTVDLIAARTQSVEHNSLLHSFRSTRFHCTVGVALCSYIFRDFVPYAPNGEIWNKKRNEIQANKTLPSMPPPLPMYFNF